MKDARGALHWKSEFRIEKVYNFTFFLHGASTKHPKQIIYKHTLINFTFSVEFPYLLVWLLHVLRGYDLERKEGLEP